MFIRVGYDISFELPNDTPMLLALNLHPSRLPTALRSEAMRVEPAIPISQFNDSFGNTCTRLNAPAGVLRITNDAVVYDNGGVGVSYEQVPELRKAKVGDRVKLCLTSVPKDCPPDDERGKYYSAEDMDRKAGWELPNAQHMCGGA